MNTILEIHVYFSLLKNIYAQHCQEKIFLVCHSHLYQVISVRFLMETGSSLPTHFRTLKEKNKQIENLQESFLWKIRQKDSQNNKVVFRYLKKKIQKV